MALDNAKKFITLILENETLRDRRANRGEEEVMAIAKETGLDFTAEELKEAASASELTPGEMEFVAGGRNAFKLKDKCPGNEGGHMWVKTGHVEDEWFSWLKKGGLWSIGFDQFKCAYCGKTKENWSH